jgi:hypothetical protein
MGDLADRWMTGRGDGRTDARRSPVRPNDGPFDRSSPGKAICGRTAILP